MKINNKLQEYIENNIFPSYEKNDLAHNLNHIKYVIKRSLAFAQSIDDINYDMVYTIASYHDIGHFIDAKNHEKVSAKMLLDDKNLKAFFNEEELKIMAEAVCDHRASLKTEPRSIYGKIISSADRNNSIDVLLKRTYAYRLKHMQDGSFEDLIEDARSHIINKFGKDGYAIKKMYFKDLEYEKFLEDISVLVENKKEFTRRFMSVNGLNNKLKLTFDEVLRHNPKMKIDDVIKEVYNQVKDEYKKPFEELKKMIIDANNISDKVS